MHVTKIACPVDHVKITFPFPEQDLQPVIENIANNNSLPAADASFPVGTITADGRLDMCKQQLGVFGIKQVAAALQNNVVVKHILLGTNAFGNQGAKAVAELVTNNNTIETVYLGCNYIEQEGCKAICEALEENQSVKSIWFKRNPIGPESIPAIIKLLSKNKQIRTLDLVNTGVGQGVHALLEYLQENDTIERLYLSGNELTAATMKYVSAMLEKNNRIRSLYLSVNDIGDEGVAELIPGLTNNTSLEELSLSSCGIGDKGMELLFTVLKAKDNIKSLDLGYAPSTRVLGAKANQLSPATADLLIAYIMEQKNVSNLNLGKIQLSEAQKNILKEEFERRNPGSLEMSGYQSKNKFPAHPDSKAIKSVYR
jgi:Ran GTPase-activating protein (RanGAP) involved in mRNA processing and transport